MNITVTIPDEHADRMVDALATRYGYDPASGQTKQQFVRQVIKDWIKGEVRIHEQGQAAAAAMAGVPPLDF